MENKELTKLTTEQLNSKINILKGILMVLSSVVILYLIYFLYALFTNTWEGNYNTIWIVMLVILGAVISLIFFQRSRIVKILKDRNEENKIT